MEKTLYKKRDKQCPMSHVYGWISISELLPQWMRKTIDQAEDLLRIQALMGLVCWCDWCDRKKEQEQETAGNSMNKCAQTSRPCWISPMKVWKMNYCNLNAWNKVQFSRFQGHLEAEWKGSMPAGLRLDPWWSFTCGPNALLYQSRYSSPRTGRQLADMADIVEDIEWQQSWDWNCKIRKSDKIW